MEPLPAAQGRAEPGRAGARRGGAERSAAGRRPAPGLAARCGAAAPGRAVSGEARRGSTGLNGAEAAASETGGSLPRLRGEGKGAGSSALTGELPREHRVCRALGQPERQEARLEPVPQVAARRWAAGRGGAGRGGVCKVLGY